MAIDRSEKHGNWPKGLSQSAIRALEGVGYTRMEQLTGITEAGVLELHGIGPKGVRILREALADIRLAFVGSSPS